MTLLPFPAEVPDAKILADNPGMLTKAKRTFPTFLADGVYAAVAGTTYYIMRITNADGTVCFGISGLASTGDYGQENGNIHPHELTLKAREAKQMEYYRTNDHLIKPILLTCPNFDELHLALQDYCAENEPILSYNAEAKPPIFVELYATKKEDVPYFESLLDKAPKPITVADGHHRISTAKQLMSEIPGLSKISVTLIPANSLGVASFVRSVNVSDNKETRKALKEFFSIESIDTDEISLPQKKGEWLMRNKKGFSRLTAHNDTELSDPEWFDQYVLPKVFGIMDSRSDERLITTPADLGVETLIKAAKKSGGTMHFLPPPVSEKEFFQKVADRGVFPPKSTRFYPRIPSGLLTYRFR